MQDDADNAVLPASARRYARLTSKDKASLGPGKVDLYVKAQGDLTHQSTKGFPRSNGKYSLGQAVKGAKAGFPNVDGGGKVDHTFAESIVDQLLADSNSGIGAMSESEDLQKPYRFVTSCVGADGQDIMDMVDQAQSISYNQFFRQVPLSEIFQSGPAYIYYWTPAQCVSAGVPYEEVRNNRGLTMKGDWHISYHRSVYQGQPCLFYAHSAIEYVFVRV